MWSDTGFLGLANPPLVWLVLNLGSPVAWQGSCFPSGCPKPKPYMAQVDVSGDTRQWQSRAAPGSRLRLLLTAPQKPRNHLWLMGIQSRSELSVSAGQHPAAVDPGASRVPWVRHCAAGLVARWPQDQGSPPSRPWVRTSTRGSSPGADPGISVRILCTSKTSKVADGLLRWLSVGWMFHITPQVLKKLSSGDSGYPACWQSHFQYAFYWVQIAQTWIRSVSTSFSTYTFILVCELISFRKKGAQLNKHTFQGRPNYKCGCTV